MQEYNVSHRRRKATLVVSYIAMTLAVISISAVCILLALGYRFDFSSQTVAQEALLQFGTDPAGAKITLDKTQLSFVAPGKKEVSAGSHDVSYTLDGYRTWQKTVSVKPGQLVWLNYARLIPTTIATNTTKQLDGYAESLPSPDRNFIALLTKADAPSLSVISLKDSKNVTVSALTFPTTQVAVPAGVSRAFHLVEWSDSLKYVVVRHDYGTTREYLRVSVSDQSDVVNLSTKFGVNLTELHMSSDTTFYGLENGNVRKFDLTNSQMSEPLVKNVVALKLYGTSDLAYVQHSASQYVVGVVVDGKNRTINTYDDVVPLQIALSKYHSDRYLAITRSSSLELIKNPEKSENDGMQRVVTLTYPSELKWLDISPAGRCVVAGNGAQFMTYDLELSARTDANFPTLLSDATVKPQWLDDTTLVSTGDNKLRLSDFDGENQQIVTDALPAQPVMLSRDDSLLYSFTKNQAGTYDLQTSKMTVSK